MKGVALYRQGRSLPVKNLLRCPNVRPRGDGKPLQMLRLIVCDADVHQAYDFSGREGAKMLRGFKFKGGVGTDFMPAIAEAAKWKPDLLIYLTDLQGNAGDDRRFQSCGPRPKAKRKRRGARSSSWIDATNHPHIYRSSYSARSATIGSTFVARRAGIQHANNPTRISSNAITMEVIGSVTVTP